MKPVFKAAMFGAGIATLLFITASDIFLKHEAMDLTKCGNLMVSAWFAFRIWALAEDK